MEKTAEILVPIGTHTKGAATEYLFADATSYVSVLTQGVVYRHTEEGAQPVPFPQEVLDPFSDRVRRTERLLQFDGNFMGILAAAIDADPELQGV